MQIIDPEDRRRPSIQIAASIRAAILNGELEPGSALPAGPKLAEQLGASRSAVANAVRMLEDEGFVTSRVGSGVYVRDQADLPVPDGAIHPLAGAATFLHEAGMLKNLPRSGWLLLGISQPESVAEHSFRVGIIGLVLASIDGADIGRTTALALCHDLHETRIGDVPSVGRAYVTTVAPETITAHQVAGMPHDSAKAMLELTAEYEANETREARLAHDADKCETLLQATEYAAQGYDAATWRENSIAALRTDAGRQLAQAIGAGDPRWWAPFNASYLELHASARGGEGR